MHVITRHTVKASNTDTFFLFSIRVKSTCDYGHFELMRKKTYTGTWYLVLRV